MGPPTQVQSLGYFPGNFGFLSHMYRGLHNLCTKKQNPRSTVYTGVFRLVDKKFTGMREMNLEL